MVEISVFEKRPGLRTSIKSSRYYVEFPVEMLRYVEAALKHLDAICEEEVLNYVVDLNTANVDYSAFHELFYEKFAKYEEQLKAINGSDFNMMAKIYLDWNERHSNLDAAVYVDQLIVNLEIKLKKGVK